MVISLVRGAIWMWSACALPADGTHRTYSSATPRHDKEPWVLDLKEIWTRVARRKRLTDASGADVDDDGSENEKKGNGKVLELKERLLEHKLADPTVTVA